MTNREKFIDYVKNGGKKPICSPQIGAGAGFDSMLSNRTWISETTLQDTLEVVARYDMLPLINLNVDFSLLDHKLTWLESKSERLSDRILRKHRLPTPFGDLVLETVELRNASPFRQVEPVIDEGDLDKFEWFLDTAMLGNFDKISEYTRTMSTQIGGLGALDFQWSMQPYELLSFPNTVNTLLLAMECEDKFFHLMDKCMALSKKIISAVAEGGADFVFLGGPAAEMVNFDIYERFMVPYSKKITDFARSQGLLVYSHICSPIEPFLTKGYYNQMGIDLFETLSMRPAGNVASIEDAFSKLDRAMCTRGNVGMEVLVHGSPDDVTKAVNHIMEEAIKFNRKHIVAASDYLVAEVKEENVKALCDAVREFTID